MATKPQSPPGASTSVSKTGARLLHEALIEQGSIRDGMLPKLEGCLTAVHGGVGSAHIVNATTPHSLLVALTDRELGTTISRQQ
ncbi:MAG: hypothetical protein IIA44_07590 [Acidobacteria bacterium]|nr:hypothetical protein [Acidobacteriota bacterium]